MSTGRDAVGSARGPAPRTRQVVIGLDVGTTAAKAVAFPTGAGPRVIASQEYPLVRPRPGWRVQDPEAVLSAVDTVLSGVTEQLGGTPVAAVSISTAMHGLIGLDPERRPLTPILTWADARARDEARELRSSPLAAELHGTLGTPLHSMSPLTKLLWFARHEPDLTAAVTTWAGLKDLVVHALTGRVVTELSSASGTGLLSVPDRTWDPFALDLAGVRRDQLPGVLPTTTALPLSAEAACRTGLPAGVPVVLGAGDGPLGNLGTGALRPGVAGLSLGTSGALRLVVDEPFADADGRLFCYALTDDHWVVGTPISNGGAVVRWAGSLLAADVPGGADRDAQVLALAGGVPPGSEGLVMLPFLLAERGPLWDADVRGAFLGLRQHHTRGHFVRAAVEGVAFQLATILDGLDAVQPVTSIRATGGVFRAPLWREVLGGVLGRPLVVTAGAEGSALGAAALGWYAVGGASTLEGALEDLSPGLLDTDPAGADAIVASPSEVDAYRAARQSAVGRLRELSASAELLAGPSRPRVAAEPATTSATRSATSGN